MLILLIGTLNSKEINYDKVLYKNSKGEYFYSQDGGQRFKKLRWVENTYKEQLFITEDDKKFISDDKGINWEQKNTKILENNSKSTSLIVYPNPSTGFITLNLSQPILKVILYNYVGKIIYEKKINNFNSTELDFSYIGIGNYFLKIITEDDIVVEKIVIKD